MFCMLWHRRLIVLLIICTDLGYNQYVNIIVIILCIKFEMKLCISVYKFLYRLD